MDGSFNSIVELLWWTLVAALLAAGGVQALRGLLARRRSERQAESQALVGPVVRKFEEAQLAKMEADGVVLWRPDPAKLKRIIERQS